VSAAESGEPDASEPAVFGAGDMDYNDYLKIELLLELQRPRSDPPHHDEMLFIIIHQAYELWFKLLIHELEQAMDCMRQGQVLRARHFMVRTNKILGLLVQQIHILETMRPSEFLKFRDHLKPASGFQSVQFREIEFMGGLKEPAYLRFFKARPEHVARLEARLEGPDLRTAFCAMLSELGFDVPADATGEALGGKGGQADRLAAALVPVYEAPDEQPHIYMLCEALLEFDETFSLWREHHVNVIERIIGFKRGTGGSSGAAYLRSTTSKRFFPFLWDVRTRLGEA
jgi:tryptophan 2,3-dioxygenase